MAKPNGYFTARNVRAALTLCLLVAAAGCGAQVDTASSIATNGQTLSTQAATSINAASDNVESFIQSQYFGAGLTSLDPSLPPLPKQINPIPAPDGQLLASFDSIEASLKLRAQMLNDLNALYVAYGNLAKYDASKEMSSAASSAITSVNAFDQALNPKAGNPVISTDDANLIKQVAGDVASAYQQQELINGSKAVRLVLEKVIAVLTKEKGTYDNFTSAITVGKINVTQALWDLGLGSADGIIESQFGNYGITFDPKQLSSIGPDVKARLALAVDGDLKYQQTRAPRLMSSTIGATIQAMQDLDNSQLKFEKGQPVDLQTVQADIQVMQIYVGLLQKVITNGKATTQTSTASK